MLDLLLALLIFPLMEAFSFETSFRFSLLQQFHVQGWLVTCKRIFKTFKTE